MSEYHNPVLLNESVSALVLNTGGVYADATSAEAGTPAPYSTSFPPRAG